MPIYLHGKDWKSYEVSKKTSLGKSWKLVTSGMLCIFVAGLCQALSQYGVINIFVSRIVMILAWLVVVAGVWTSDYLYNKPRKQIIGCTLLVGVALGGGFWWLDAHGVERKMQMEAESKPPALPAASGPRVPIVPTQFPNDKPSIRTDQYGKDNGAAGGTISGVSEPPERNWELPKTYCDLMLGDLKGTNAQLSIGWLPSNTDGAHVASELADCLTRAPGWSIETATLPVDVNGILIEAHARDSSVAALEKAFAHIGLRAIELVNVRYPAEIVVIIGNHSISPTPAKAGPE